MTQTLTEAQAAAEAARPYEIANRALGILVSNLQGYYVQRGAGEYHFSSADRAEAFRQGILELAPAESITADITTGVNDKLGVLAADRPTLHIVTLTLTDPSRIDHKAVIGTSDPLFLSPQERIKYRGETSWPSSSRTRVTLDEINRGIAELLRTTGYASERGPERAPALPWFFSRNGRTNEMLDHVSTLLEQAGLKRDTHYEFVKSHSADSPTARDTWSVVIKDRTAALNDYKRTAVSQIAHSGTAAFIRG